MGNRWKSICAALAVMVSAHLANAAVIMTSNFATVQATPAFQTLNIDLNHDSIDDLRLESDALIETSIWYANKSQVISLNGTQFVWGSVTLPPIGPVVKALPTGTSIESGSNWSGGGLLYNQTSRFSPQSGSDPAWNTTLGNVSLGVEFFVGGQPHYGWVNLKVDHTTTTVGNYAYETNANTPVGAGQVPEPGIGVVATGLVALTKLRRRRATGERRKGTSRIN